MLINLNNSFIESLCDTSYNRWYMAKKKNKQSTNVKKSKSIEVHKYVVAVRKPTKDGADLFGFKTKKDAKDFMKDVFNEMGLETAIAKI